MIPYGQNITDKDIESVVEVLKSDFITVGPAMKNLKKKSVKAQCRFSIAVNSATSALHLACLALGLNKGVFMDIRNFLCCVCKSRNLLWCYS